MTNTLKRGLISTVLVASTSATLIGIANRCAFYTPNESFLSYKCSVKFGVTDSICDLSTVCLNTQTSGFQVQHIFNDVDKERWCYYEGDSVIVTLYELDDVTIASFSDKYCRLVRIKNNTVDSGWCRVTDIDRLRVKELLDPILLYEEHRNLSTDIVSDYYNGDAGITCTQEPILVLEKTDGDNVWRITFTDDSPSIPSSDGIKESCDEFISTYYTIYGHGG